MKPVNGIPANDRPWPSPKTATQLAEEEAAYQSIAKATDEGITHVMNAALLPTGSTPGAVVAGSVMALVRFCLQTMEVPKTVRNVFALLGPSVNRAAEEILAQEAPPPAEPGS